MNKEILFVLLDEFAEWESAFIAALLNFGTAPGRARYTVKTLSVTRNPVVSIGGFHVLPDYDLQSVPADYAGLILIGGMRWFAPEAQQLVPLVQDAIDKKKLVAGICNASVFLGMHGWLDRVKHTSNTLEYLKKQAGDHYAGEAYYINEQAARDGRIVTANGSGYLEFCREILYALEADTPEKIEESYRFYKDGLCELMKNGDSTMFG